MTNGLRPFTPRILAAIFYSRYNHAEFSRIKAFLKCCRILTLTVGWFELFFEVELGLAACYDKYFLGFEQLAVAWLGIGWIFFAVFLPGVAWEDNSKVQVFALPTSYVCSCGNSFVNNAVTFLKTCSIIWPVVPYTRSSVKVFIFSTMLWVDILPKYCFCVK